MDIADDVFRYKSFDYEKLACYGFKRQGGIFVLSSPILAGQFVLNVQIEEGKAHSFVTETDTGEPFVLYGVAEATGSFIGQMRSEAEALMCDIAAKCCFEEYLKWEQTKRLFAHALQTYGDKPEFLWESYPDCAVLRCKQNARWYAAVLTVNAAKLTGGEGTLEVIDLRGDPDDIQSFIDGALYFPAYHMNKKHWYTVVLNGSVGDGELFERLKTSYAIALASSKGAPKTKNKKS